MAFITLLVVSLLASRILTNSQKFPLHRILQYKIGTKEFGSFVSLTNGNVDIFEDISLPVRLTRKVFLLKYEKLIQFTKDEGIEWFDEFMLRKDVLAAIIILPKINAVTLVHDKTGGIFQGHVMRKIEQRISTQKYFKPIYFIDNTTDVNDLYGSFHSGNNFFSMFKNYKYTVIEQPFQRESQPMYDTFTSYNIFSDLKIAKKNSHKNTPTIAIVASYDTLSIIPDISGGMTFSSGHTLIAILELIRVFKTLYSHKTTEGNVNFIFALTAGSMFNQEGTKNFVKKYFYNGRNLEELKESGQGLYRNVKFVLYLDSLMHDDLYMHVSKKFEDTEVIKILTHFKKVARTMKINLKVSLSAPARLPNNEVLLYLDNDDVDDSMFEWEHEIFQRNSIASATLSGIFSKDIFHTSTTEKKNEKNYGTWSNFQLIRSSISDRTLNTTLFIRNIKYIGESLINYIYENNPVVSTMEILSDDIFDEKFVTKWIFSLSEFGRSTPFLNKDNEIIEGIIKTITKYIKPKIQTYKSKVNVIFYDVPYTQMVIYNVKPVAFEIVLMILVVIFLFCLMIFFQGKDKTLRTIVGLFKTQKVKVK